MIKEIDLYQGFLIELEELGPLLPLGITKDCHLERTSQEIKQYQELLDNVRKITHPPGKRVLSYIEALASDIRIVVSV